MAIYHFEAKVITRGVGRSVVAAAAYASCSQIYNDYDGIQHDYVRKRGNIYSEIFLPNNAPDEWQDRKILWNAVEIAEKSKDSRLARELIVALPVELQIDEWKSILKEFIIENCVDKGMCADVNIHDTDGHNPHAHILLTMRPLDEKGKWQANIRKVQSTADKTRYVPSGTARNKSPNGVGRGKALSINRWSRKALMSVLIAAALPSAALTNSRQPTRVLPRVL